VSGVEIEPEILIRGHELEAGLNVSQVLILVNRPAIDHRTDSTNGTCSAYGKGCIRQHRGHARSTGN
jgi:hypothetical protein